jgi:hypothetical protein
LLDRQFDTSYANVKHHESPGISKCPILPSTADEGSDPDQKKPDPDTDQIENAGPGPVSSSVGKHEPSNSNITHDTIFRHELNKSKIVTIAFVEL